MIAVYVNPAAGSGRAGRTWARIAAGEPRIAGARVILAADVGAARAELDAVLEDRRLERLVVVGGDGTAQLVANRLRVAGRTGDVALGLVPAGTGSDLARSLALPRRPDDALRRALDGVPRPYDALELVTAGGERRLAVNTVSTGLSGHVSRAVNAAPRRGAASYLGATVATLLRYRAVRCRVEVDGNTLHDGEVFAVVVANGRYFGKGMKVAPDARLDDGLADVVVIPPVPLWTLPLRLPQLIAGHHVRLPFVHTARARRVRLVPDHDVAPFEVDGETVSAGPATVTIAAGALPWVT